MPRILFGVTVAMTANAFLRDQLQALADDRWDVHLACSPLDGTDSWNRLQDLNGVTLHPVAMHRNPRPLSDLASLFAWIRLVKALQPAVVVSSTPKAGLLGMLASRIQSTPTRIYHVRGLRMESLRGLSARIGRLSEKMTIASSTEVLVDSESLRSLMRNKGLLQATQGTVLGKGSCCGVDTDWFRPPTDEERTQARRHLGFTDDETVIGFVGRISEDKGIKELLTAVATARSAHPDLKLVLVGPTEAPDELRALVHRCTSEGWVLATGSVTDVRSCYWSMDILCLPSYREGFPISLLEGQACGLPVITTDATGCIDAVESGYTGLIVEKKNAAALQEAVNELSDNSVLRISMGTQARAWIEEGFNRDKVRKETIAFIESATQVTR